MERVVRARTEPFLDQRQYCFWRIRLRRQQRSDQRRPSESRIFFCTDGSFSDLISANVSYTSGGFYVTAAYEWHHAVNRQSDIQGMFGIGTPGWLVGAFGNCQDAATTTLQSTLCIQDVADEDAAKIGALYKFRDRDDRRRHCRAHDPLRAGRPRIPKRANALGDVGLLKPATHAGGQRTFRLGACLPRAG